MKDAAAAHAFQHVDWCRSANLYQVNLRQYTPEGTFAAFARHLPRLRTLGVDILWLMPVHPVGRKHRKGRLGSPYAVADYGTVNPEFGTLQDFRRLVQAIHAAGMHVIIDWVANHTAWDHLWVTQHPGWYKKNAQGEICACEYDNGREIECWTDVVGLDYGQPTLWPAMTEAMLYWVNAFDIDGYRCDVAGLVPIAFWEQARAALDAAKPVFMLAEATGAALHRAFDMTYDWDLYDLLLRVARGAGGPADLAAWLQRRQTEYPRDALRLCFTSNHDKNSWEGHDVELFGDAFEACAVLAATLPGLPLIYGGQESVLDRRLAFFEKDPIAWKRYARAPLYQWLLALKHDNPALWNGAAGADAELLPDAPQVFAFRRSLPGNSVTLRVNLSARPVPPRDGEEALPPWGWALDVTG